MSSRLQRLNFLCFDWRRSLHYIYGIICLTASLTGWLVAECYLKVHNCHRSHSSLYSRFRACFVHEKKVFLWGLGAAAARSRMLSDLWSRSLFEEKKTMSRSRFNKKTQKPEPKKNMLLLYQLLKDKKHTEIDNLLLYFS